VNVVFDSLFDIVYFRSVFVQCGSAAAAVSAGRPRSISYVAAAAAAAPKEKLTINRSAENVDLEPAENLIDSIESDSVYTHSSISLT
jgi:hypothetical protein